jgi:hypothetical protein
MTDRQKLVDRGNHAKRLLEDELLVECFDRIEKDIFDEWKLTGLNNYDERTDLFLTLKCLERLKARLRAILDDGTIALRS